jgi:glycosyltransferase involved in cell wall biosynthesis
LTIGIVINTSWNILNFRSGLIKFLQGLGHQVIAIAPKDAYSDQLSQLCHYVELPMDNKGSNPFNDYYTYKTLKKIYSENRLDLVLQYTIKPNIYGSLAAQRLNIPTINNVSGLGTIFIRSNITSKIAIRLYRRAFKKVAHVFFQNKDDEQVFRDLRITTNQSISVLPGSGVDLEKFKPKKSPTTPNTHFLMVARLLYDKGILEFLHAADTIKKEHPSCKFSICGFIEPQAGLGIPEEELINWQKRGIIEYLGVSDNIKIIYETADVVVLPSYREGTPKTLLEAAAMGKPIITTDVPGCREVVDHEYNGILCQPKSAISLSNAMEQFLAFTPEKRTLYGSNSRILAEERFDEKLVFSAYEKAINKEWK